MSADNIIRAWKDEEFRLSLSAGERALLPSNPAGLIELTDEALSELVAGAAEAGSCCWRSCNTKASEVPTEPTEPTVEAAE